MNIYGLTCQAGPCQCGLETEGGQDGGLEADPTIQLDLTSGVGDGLIWRIMRWVCSIP